jgi:hypothetical protein
MVPFTESEKIQTLKFIGIISQSEGGSIPKKAVLRLYKIHKPSPLHNHGEGKVSEERYRIPEVPECGIRTRTYSSD